MARKCEICGKGPVTGNIVSHAHNKSRRRWLPNLQNVRAVSGNGRTVRMRVCTRCIRTGSVKKAQFCAGCHEYTGVTLDCFSCHSSTPNKGGN